MVMFVVKLYFMKKLSNKTKRIIKNGLISGFTTGIVYASLMAAYEWFDSEVFKIEKFLFNFLFFSAVMGVVFGYSTKKQIEREQ